MTVAANDRQIAGKTTHKRAALSYRDDVDVGSAVLLGQHAWDVDQERQDQIGSGKEHKRS